MREVNMVRDLSKIEKVTVDNLLDVKSINVEKTDTKNTVMLSMIDGSTLDIEYDKVNKKVIGLIGDHVHVAFNSAMTTATVIMPGTDKA